MRTQRFAGKRVLITGASSGIGAALAEQFAAEGAELLLTGRREERLQALAERLRQRNARASVCRCDVTLDSDVPALCAFVQHGAGLDVLVANAGFGVAGAFTALTLADYRRQFETNVFGVLRTIYALLPMLQQSRGRLVLLGSVAGHVPMPGTSAYGMSKFAVRALALALRVELAPAGIGVTLISPGFIDSEIRQVDNHGRLHATARDPVPRWLRARAPRAARVIVAASYARRRECVVTAHGRLTVWMYRHFPAIVHWALQRAGRSRPEPR